MLTLPANRVLALLIVLGCSGFFATIGNAETIKSVSINGHVYELILSENAELIQRVTFKQERQIADTHYRGRIKEYPDSWARVSEINGSYQGIVSISGETYTINSPADAAAVSADNTAQAQPGQLLASPITSSEPRACGVDHSPSPVLSPAFSPETSQHLTQHEPHETNSALRIAREVAFSSLCSSTINGTCLIAELELAFDADFVDLFANTTEASNQAMAIVNITEGYYLNDFDISFEALSMELLDNNVSSETEAGELLNDLSAAKDNGNFSFLQNPRAIFHLVTGRDLDGGTAGIAFVGEICTTNAVGLTSVLMTGFGGGSPNIPLTATVMAHELGHNFGAEHDVDPNTACGTGFIMEAAVNSLTSEFSSCSIDEIITEIESVNTPALCFNFPADAAITAAPGNPATVTNSEEFTSSYEVASENSFQAIPTLTVSGSVPSSQGQFTAVTLGGQSCSLGGQGQSYTCNLSNPNAMETLIVNTVPTSTALDLTHTTAISGSADIRDVDSSNDQLVASFTVVGGQPPQAPSGLNATQGNATDVNLSWTDNSNNETGFNIERRLMGGTFSQLAQLGVNVTSFVDTTSAATNTYEYRVSAENANGVSAPSPVATVTVTEPTSPPPAAPSNLSAEQGAGTNVNLTWQDNSSDEDNFVVQRRLAGGTFTELQQLGANVTSFTDTTSMGDNTYEYQVLARNSNGSSAPSGSVQIAVNEPTTPPPSNGGNNPPSSDGGGGGSFHWSMLVCLGALAWRRLRRHNRAFP